jgi:hypothetical protein
MVAVTTERATDAARWSAAIDAAVREPGPAHANLLITQMHHDLGLARRDRPYDEVATRRLRAELGLTFG